MVNTLRCSLYYVTVRQYIIGHLLRMRIHIELLAPEMSQHTNAMLTHNARQSYKYANTFCIIFKFAFTLQLNRILEICKYSSIFIVAFKLQLVRLPLGS